MSESKHTPVGQGAATATLEQRNAALPETFRSLKEIAGRIDPEKGRAILQQLIAAQARFEDTYLDLALIGEFNCGKSTFINALFGRDVLATAMMPTTAVPTYLRWENDDGEFEITVYTKSRSYALADPEARARFEKAFHLRLPERMEQMIDAVTTNNKLSDRITRVEIVAPRNERMRGIRLIDTPGINPGMEGTAAHVRTTQEVLRNEADAAIIIFPAERICTADFKRFIEENMSHLLNHSIFVITQCDRIRNKDDLKSIAEFAAGQLTLSGVQNPVIHCISAARALNVYMGVSNSPEDMEWCRRFEETIREIFGSLAERHSEIVYSNITAVVREISKVVAESVQSRGKALLESKKNIETLSPARMKRELESIRKRFVKDIEQRMRQLSANTPEVIASGITKCKTRHFATIDLTLNDKKLVTDYVKNFSKDDMWEVVSAANAHVTRYTDYLKDRFDRYSEDVIACIRRYIDGITSDALDLQVAGGPSVEIWGTIPISGSYLTPSGILGFSKALFDRAAAEFNMVSEDPTTTILTIVLMPLMLPFAVISGAYNLLRSLDSIKSEAKETIGKVLNSQKDAVNKRVDEIMARLHDNYCAAASDLPKQIEEQFFALYRAASTRHDNQTKAVERELSRMRSYLSKLKKIDQLYGVGIFPAEM